MHERRSLVEALKQSPTVDPKIEKEFVFQAKPPVITEPTSPPSTPAPSTVSRSPISTRIRSDFAAALKRASLERQLAGLEPQTLQDILEEAIEPWLKTNGYLA
jgi:hypothetical protein